MGGQEVDIGRRKGEPRAAGTGRYKGEKVNAVVGVHDSGPRYNQDALYSKEL